MGKRIEREAPAYLRSLGLTARRGQRHAGRADSPDVIMAGLPGVHIEVKGDKAIGIGTAALTAALAQSHRDVDACGAGGRGPGGRRAVEAPTPPGEAHLVRTGGSGGADHHHGR